MKKRYLFKSNRLGFRNWVDTDLKKFTELNADREVMEHFPKPLTAKESVHFLFRLKEHFEKNGYCYFATEVLETREFIGFIGLAFQKYKSDFTPAVDIGWRLKRSAWGKGYATEGAKRCIDWAFDSLNLERLISTCTKNNTRSENVMKKIGMVKKGNFKHARLKQYPKLEECIYYEIVKK